MYGGGGGYGGGYGMQRPMSTGMFGMPQRPPSDTYSAPGQQIGNATPMQSAGGDNFGTTQPMAMQGDQGNPAMRGPMDWASRFQALSSQLSPMKSAGGDSFGYQTSKLGDLQGPHMMDTNPQLAEMRGGFPPQAQGNAYGLMRNMGGGFDPSRFANRPQPAFGQSQPMDASPTQGLYPGAPTPPGYVPPPPGPWAHYMPAITASMFMGGKYPLPQGTSLNQFGGFNTQTNEWMKNNPFLEYMQKMPGG